MVQEIELHKLKLLLRSNWVVQLRENKPYLTNGIQKEYVDKFVNVKSYIEFDPSLYGVAVQAAEAEAYVSGSGSSGSAGPAAVSLQMVLNLSHNTRCDSNLSF